MRQMSRWISTMERFEAKQSKSKNENESPNERDTDGQVSKTKMCMEV